MKNNILTVVSLFNTANLDTFNHEVTFNSQKVRERFLDLFNEENIESKYLAYFLGYLGNLENLYKEALSDKDSLSLKTRLLIIFRLQELSNIGKVDFLSTEYKIKQSEEYLNRFSFLSKVYKLENEIISNWKG